MALERRRGGKDEDVYSCVRSNTGRSNLFRPATERTLEFGLGSPDPMRTEDGQLTSCLISSADEINHKGFSCQPNTGRKTASRGLVSSSRGPGNF
ncbi:hypothetical protein EYF80_040646 [Liparis tanakae]|uniref:Uncharacterized protein n=1 Tax=Liparis tanakae TaxID=230148 RepID=A0A4Z2G6E6_9TELE|nr:hypothetical protein EYF80_040646 [Liparis tanakae]